MKKSKYVSLVLITATLASCNQATKSKEWGDEKPTVHLRSDTTAPYTRAHHHSGIGTALLWYYAFRPYGRTRDNRYQGAGYYSGGINAKSNVGNNPMKGNIIRGGFGKSFSRVSS